MGDTVPAIPAQGWAPPLDRSVTLDARDVSLRDALDRLAAAAGIRLSYSADVVPVDTRVCASFRSVALGGALGVTIERRGDTAVVSPTRGAPPNAPRTAPAGSGAAPRPR